MNEEEKWEFNSALMKALNLDSMRGIIKIQIDLEAMSHPILTVVKVLDTEKSDLIKILDKYEITLTPKKDP